MVRRPVHLNAFEFVVVSSLRTAQLVRGSVPRVPPGEKPLITAQREVAEGHVTREPGAAYGLAPVSGSRDVLPLEPVSGNGRVRSSR